jgi:hypothetical protein
MSEPLPAAPAGAELEPRLRALAVLLGSLAEETAEIGCRHTFALLRQARLALIEEAARRHGISL